MIKQADFTTLRNAEGLKWFSAKQLNNDQTAHNFGW